jgi:cysteine desulfurase
MLQWLDCGNPSSLYAEGRAAKARIDAARETLSESLGSLFAEVLFTGSGTEAANMALVGAALANSDPRRSRILIGAADHHCVLHARPVLERLGYQVGLLPVTREAQIDLDALTDSLADDVLIVGTMHANNELGTINDISEISRLVKGVGALLFVDAVQTFCKLDCKVDHLGADLLAVSAHKIGGPKGVGAIYVRAGVPVKPLIVGGGQEREMRGGTENVSAIAGFDAAVQSRNAPSRLLSENRSECPTLRDDFEQRLIAAGAVPSVTLSPRLDTHSHVRFPGINAETMLIRLDRSGISASSGAACSSGSIEPSHVLIAAGYTPERAKEGLRFTFGPQTTPAQAAEAARRIVEAVTRIRVSQG